MWRTEGAGRQRIAFLVIKNTEKNKSIPTALGTFSKMVVIEAMEWNFFQINPGC